MTMTERVATDRERAPRPAQSRATQDASPPARLLALQRSFGNRAVTTLVQRACTGEGCCAACSGSSQDAPAEAVEGGADHLQRQAVDGAPG